MSKSAKKTANTKLSARIALAVLLVLTLAFTVFGITGTAKEGHLYYYRSWIPASFKTWPEALRTASDIGAVKTVTLNAVPAGETEPDAQKISSVLSKRLSVLGIYDGQVSVEGTTVSVSYPASAEDASGDLAAAVLGYTGTVNITWGGQDALTNDDLAVVKTYSGQNGGYVLEIRFTENGKKALKALAETRQNDNLEILLDGVSVTGSNFSTEGTDFIDKGLFLYMNESETARIQSLLYAAGLGCGDLGAALTVTDTAVTHPDDCVLPVLILIVVLAACCVVMILSCKKTGIAGIWGLVLFYALGFFCVAELLQNTGYINLLCVILIALMNVLFTYNFISEAAAIENEKASRSNRAAIGFGFKADLKNFYLFNGAAFVIGFVLAFIPAVKIYGCLLMLGVLLNIVVNRLFVRLVLRLSVAASDK